MTFNANENYSGRAGLTYPRALSTSTRPQVIAGTGSELTLPRLTPLFYNSTTKKYEVWSDSDATIDGFLWPDTEYVLPANTDDNLVTVMKGGTVHYDDIPLPAGQTQDTMKAVLQGTPMREKGFTIDGLAGTG